jgi:dTDP-4-dehydrorhamnose 3,5-epimerase-like enzyme
MPQLIGLPTHSDPRGSLTVCEKLVPFEIKRVFMIYGVPAEEVRGGHRHKRTTQALVCLRGSCQINVELYGRKTSYRLDRPDQLLLLNPEDWHTMSHFSSDACLLALSSDFYDQDDYVTTPLNV